MPAAPANDQQFEVPAVRGAGSMKLRAKRLDGSPVTIFAKDVTAYGDVCLTTKFTVGRKIRLVHVDRALADRIPNHQADVQKQILRQMGIDPDSLPFASEVRALG
jgi:hypothetical protein